MRPQDASRDSAPDGAGILDLEPSEQALQRALSHARAGSDRTLLRNLEWYAQRRAGRSYDAIARDARRVPGTVRTGVARARRHVLSVAHELRIARPAPLDGGAPAAIEPLRKLWVAQDLDDLAHGLDATRDAFGDDPHWLNLTGLLKADRGDLAGARSTYESGLLFADAPEIRARLLNNLGNLADDEGDPAAARLYWLRAHQLLPRAPTPLINLLAGASRARDYESAQHYLAEIGDLLSRRRLTDEDRVYLLRRLRECPELDWLRDTDAWQLGPARWIRSDPRAARRRAGAATLLTLLLGLLLLIPARADADPWSTSRRSAAARPASRALVGHSWSARGGDSMGSPTRERATRSAAWKQASRAGGDSMGRPARSASSRRSRRGR
jgi:tetratricopeptide (TPR) repeat protein